MYSIKEFNTKLVKKSQFDFLVFSASMSSISISLLENFKFLNFLDLRSYCEEVIVAL